MKIEVTMPKMSPEMRSGVLCAWLKGEGDRVRRGEALFEVETEKVVCQVEAERDGVLVRLLAEEGDDMPVGAVLAEMEAQP